MNSVQNQFNGFSKELIDFFAGLEEDNSKEWFNAHKKEFDEYFMTPAENFVLELGGMLKTISPGIIADPRKDRSIFRINRNLRFSRDKTPYKTHLAILFWEGVAKLESSGFYFHLDKNSLMLGAGIYIFSKPALEKFRENVTDKKKGREFSKAVNDILSKGSYNIGGEHYKKIPSGFDSSHENAPYLLYNGLWAGMSTNIPEELFSADLIEYCFQKYRDMLPLHQWLVKNLS